EFAPDFSTISRAFRWTSTDGDLGSPCLSKTIAAILLLILIGACCPPTSKKLLVTHHPSHNAGNEYGQFSEVDLLMREDGGRQVHSRKGFGRSGKCCPSRAGRFLECPVSWRDHRHSGLRGPLCAIEERAHATHLRSLVE